ncbi:MAG: hypothetical protein RXR43_10460 [Sulfolobus sp.]
MSEKGEKVNEVEELRRELGLERKDLDLGDYMVLMGKILSFKARGNPSAHSVTKEVREALEEVRENPTGDVEEIIKVMVSQDTPFYRADLSKLYREALEGLLRTFAEKVRNMSPRESRKLMNLVLEGIYNNAVFYSPTIGAKIIDIMKGGGKKDE